MNQRLTSDAHAAPNIRELIMSALHPQIQPLKHVMSSLEEKLDTMSQAQSESHESSRSISQCLSSLESRVSQLSQLLSVSANGNGASSVRLPTESISGMEWCCDAISGIEAAFETDHKHGKCLYCSKNFVHQPGDPDAMYKQG